jgi:CRISPR-associated protein Csd1
MILQALEAYYRRKVAQVSRDGEISPVGPEGWKWEEKEIPFLIVLDEEGRFLRFEDTREGEGRQRRAKKFLVPQGEKRSSGIKANLFWDNVEYVLGANPRGRTDVAKRHQAFRDRFREGVGTAAGQLPFRAVLRFLEEDPLAQIDTSGAGAIWKEVLESNAFLTFRIQGSAAPTICEALKDLPCPFPSDRSEGKAGICLVTGEKGPVARLHPAIKGVRGTNSSGGSLVSFNRPAFEFYGKKQNYNAPVGESATFAYTSALNLLLGKDSENKALVGDATTVFWSERRETEASYDLEKNLPWFLADPPKDDPDRGIRAVQGLLAAVRSGELLRWGENRFYLLGLSPNAARISVRFWQVGTIREFSENLAKHFDDMEILRGPKDPEFLSLSQILRAIALEGKLDNVPPKLAGEIVSSAVGRKPYPRTLLHRCVGRIRAERSVNRPRAAILKACLNRDPRRIGKEALQVGLDRNNIDAGYRLGRLFAVLEKIQEEASPGINATIRDRFYGAASTSPVAVFSQLLKLKNHHIAKIGNSGRRVNLEREIGEIMNAIDRFPAHLTLDQQAMFAVGYYHQRQKFFSKYSDNPAMTSVDNN